MSSLLLLGMAVSAWCATAETVCLQCHGTQSGRLGAPVALWRTSVHAANGIGCHSCHGGDPHDVALAMSPARGFVGVPQAQAVPDFCGRCHVGVREDYLASAHGQALGNGGPQCVTCHGNHAVQAASLALINADDCSRCHEYGRAEEIRGAMQQVDARISRANARLAELHRIGIATRATQGDLFALRNDFHRLFHAVEVAKVRRETGRFSGRLDVVEARLHEIDGELAWRRVAGGVVVGLLLLAGVLSLLLRKTYRDEEQGGGPG